jgi:hypothetical protein
LAASVALSVGKIAADLSRRASPSPGPCLPPKAADGDFYDVIPLGGDRWAYFLGDVCGKGAETTAGTSLTRCTVRVAAQHHSNPVDVLAALNSALLLDSSIGNRYCPISVGADRTPGLSNFLPQTWMTL